MAPEPESGEREHVPPFPRLCRYLSERPPQAMVAVNEIADSHCLDRELAGECRHVDRLNC